MLPKVRYERKQADEKAVLTMIKNGQFDLGQRLDHKYMENMARHSLDWPIGRLNAAVDRIIEKIKQRNNEIQAKAKNKTISVSRPAQRRPAPQTAQR
jgi:hypothetical protein